MTVNSDNSKEKMCDLLVSCEWLKGQIEGKQSKDLVIVDVSWSSSKNCEEDFLREHIPGALYLNVMDAKHDDLYPRNIPTLETFQENVRKAGINNSSHVIVYSNTDHCGFFMSGRAWWTFQIFGHPKVSILDGGFQKWKMLDYTTTDKTTETQVGNFEAKWNAKYYRQIDEVLENLPNQHFQLLDSRAAASHTEHGRIPHSHNIPLSLLMDQEMKQMKPLEEVKKLFKEAGVDLSKPITSHCNSGMSSCTIAMVAQMCGNNDVSVYHGGFTEWKNKAPGQIEKNS